MKFFDTKEFFKFLLTGGIAASVNFFSRIVFNIWLSFSASIYLAYLVGMITAYLLKRHFVFTKSKQPISHSIGFFILINMIAFLQTLAVTMAVFIYALPFLGIHKMAHEIAHIIGICTPIFTSYIGHKKLSFR